MRFKLHPTIARRSKPDNRPEPVVLRQYLDELTGVMVTVYQGAPDKPPVRSTGHE